MTFLLVQLDVVMIVISNYLMHYFFWSEFKNDILILLLKANSYLTLLPRKKKHKYICKYLVKKGWLVYRVNIVVVYLLC